MFKPKRILVATDFTAESDAALREAIGIGEQFRSTIYLLHVIPEPVQYGFYYPLDEPLIAAGYGRLRDIAERRMDEMIRRVGPDSIVQIMKEIRFGNTIDEIIAAERDHDIELVMAATHRPRHRWLGDTHHVMYDLVSRSACEAIIVR
jgi:nucleotide-binding universal stress UspA family protein